MNDYKLLFVTILSLFSIKTYSQNDCKDFITICGNDNISDLTATGAGPTEDFKDITRCKLYEYNTLWLKIDIKKGGTLGFTLTPESRDLDIDFDFYVFGPNVSCDNVGEPIRYSLTNPKGAKITTNITGMSDLISNIYFGGLGYQDDCKDLGNNGTGFVKWLDTKDNESYFIVISRYSGETKFSIKWTGTATFHDTPSINIPNANALDIEKSDFSGEPNPSVNFDLSVNTPIIIGSQTGVAVTYHTSSNDAIINANPIDPTTFKNTTNPQTIYTRITNTTSQCYNSTSFNIKVNSKLIFSKDKFEICDDSDTNPTDGKTKIDLDKVTATIFDNQDVSMLTINYYSSQNDADNDSNKLPNPFYNTTPFEQSIFIKAISNESIKATQEIKLTINPLPQVNTISLVQCDSGVNANGLVVFNLKEANPILTNNNPDIETSFFINNSDALNNINPLLTEYTNISNPQTLFVRVTNSKTKCNSISNLTLKANVISEVTYSINPACDDDGNEDGIHIFNLTEANIPLTNNQKIKYYSTENDALLEQNKIETPDSYYNQIPYNQLVFARIEEENDCFGISKIKLEVSKLPNITTESTTNVCENNLSYYTLLDAGITNNPAINDFLFLWKKDGTEIPNQTSSTLDINTTGIYTVTVTNKANCNKTRTIEVTSSNTATIKSVDIVDLQTDNSNKVTVNVTGNGEYEYSLNAPNGPFQESNVFNNVSSGIHEIYINDKKNCGSISKTIAVLGVPKFFTPNNDSYNDYWNIKGIDETFNTGAKIFIYDRYGKLIKQILPSSNGWDGTFIGNQMPSDDYWYTLKLEDGREAKGHFSLIR